MLSDWLIRSFTLAIVAGLTLLATIAPAQAQLDVILKGSDYLETVADTFFEGLGELKGLPFGPGETDTVVERQGNCFLDLTIMDSCPPIAIELVALSLQSTTNPDVLVRAGRDVNPLLAPSTGNMTIVSDGSGFGGTFTSFFDVHFEISFDGGQTWLPPEQLELRTTDDAPGSWTTIEPPSPPAVLVDGPVGDQAANRHTGKEVCQDDPEISVPGCFDFYIVGVVVERHPEEREGVHSARQAEYICDIDGDGDVDRNDINLILRARNTAAEPEDLRDVNGDGMITVQDAKICIQMCTNLNCAP